MKVLVYSDFYCMAKDSLQCGAASDETPSESRVSNLAKLAYEMYLKGEDWESVLE